MQNRFAEMDCYVLAGGPRNPERDAQREGDMTRLERGYRRYAKVFEKVILVVKQHQARVPYVNYPHICDDEADQGAVYGIKTALREAESEAVFIGSSEIIDFPLELLYDLVTRYNGEMFLGYRDWLGSPGEPQPLFGVFHKKLVRKLEQAGESIEALQQVLAAEGKFVPLPAHAQ